MASLQAYQSHGIRYYRIVESFRREGKPSIRVLAAACLLSLAGTAAGQQPNQLTPAEIDV